MYKNISFVHNIAVIFFNGHQTWLFFVQNVWMVFSTTRRSKIKNLICRDIYGSRSFVFWRFEATLDILKYETRASKLTSGIEVTSILWILDLKIQNNRRMWVWKNLYCFDYHPRPPRHRYHSFCDVFRYISQKKISEDKIYLWFSSIMYALW